MRNLFRYGFPILTLCFLSVTAALAQDDAGYVTGMTTFSMLVSTLMYFLAYLVAYSIALPLTLSFIDLFRGFEVELIYWVLLLWGGGMGIDYLVCNKFLHFSHPLLAALLAIPLLFCWIVFISTRSFADLTWPNAVRVGVVLALVCAPWFGATWRFIPQPKQPFLNSSRPVAVCRLAVALRPSISVDARELRRFTMRCGEPWHK
jgi:hypothetical protein